MSNLKPSLSILAKIISHIMLFAYTAYFINKDTPNTGFSSIELCIPPFILTLLSATLYFPMKTSDRDQNAIKSLSLSTIILCCATLFLVFTVYRSGAIMQYDDWIGKGMPPRPTDANLLPMLTLFCGISLSALPSRLSKKFI